MKKTRAVVILNPSSNHGRAPDELEKALPYLKQEFDFDLVVSKHPGFIREFVSTVDNVEAVLVAGGDGSVHEAVNGIVASNKDVVLGIIPVGTGNDAARSYGIPFNPVKAARTLCEKNVASVDIGRFNDIYYANSLGIGLDGLVAHKAHDLRENSRLRGVPLYIKALNEVLKEWEPFELEFSSDEFTIRESVMLSAVNVGRSYGGGFFVTPDAFIDDGLFDICIVREIPRWQVMPRLPFFITGKYGWMKVAVKKRAKRVSIRASREVYAQLDGETYPMTEADIEVMPAHLKVYTGKRAFLCRQA